MPVEKVSLSLEADVVAEARAASGGNLSAYVNDALLARVRNRGLRQALDEFEAEFPAMANEEESALRRRVQDAFAAADAGAEALEETLVRGTALLNEHPLVDEAVVTRGPMRLPVGYVIVADEQQPIASVAAELTRHLQRHLGTGWQVPLAIVARGADGRPGGLSAVAPA